MCIEQVSLAATTIHMSTFLPLLITNCNYCVGEKEEVRSDGETYNKKLIEAGINSNLFIKPNTGHISAIWYSALEKAFRQ